MKDANKYKDIYIYRNELPDWLQEFRENLVVERSPSEPRWNPEPGYRDTSNASHELPMESRAKVEPGSGKQSVFSHLPKDPNCDIYLKTKITRASCRRRAGTVVPRAEHFGDLITADHKNSVKKVTRVTIIDVSWWYKIWQHSGYNHTVSNEIFTGNTEKPNEVLGADKETQSHLHWQFPRIWQIPVKIFHGITVRRHHTDRKQMGLQKELCAEWEKGHLRCCCSPVWMTNGGRIPWKCHCYLRSIQDLLSDGKTPYERQFGVPKKGPIIPSGSDGRVSPCVCWGLGSRLHQFGPKVLPSKFLGCALHAGGNPERRHWWSQTLKNWNRWTHQNSTPRRLNAKEVLTPRSGVKI